jgi:hypothetical protein
MAKLNKVKLPSELYTDTFLKMAKYYADKFITEKGYGKWLAEYQAMLEAGQFRPGFLRSAYICIKQGKAESFGFIKFDAINHICVLALDATRNMLSNERYAIQLITGEIAVDDNDVELTGLQLEEAMTLCKEMNEEAEEELFKIIRI